MLVWFSCVCVFFFFGGGGGGGGAVSQFRHIAGFLPELKRRKVQSSEYQLKFTLEFAFSKHLSYINAKSAGLKQVVT